MLYVKIEKQPLKNIGPNNAIVFELETSDQDKNNKAKLPTKETPFARTQNLRTSKPPCICYWHET